MHASELGDFEFCADAIRAGHQHWVFVVTGEELTGEIELKQPRESTLSRQYAGRVGSPHQGRQPRHGLGIKLKVDARILISRFCHKGCDFMAAIDRAEGAHKGARKARENRG